MIILLGLFELLLYAIILILVVNFFFMLVHITYEAGLFFIYLPIVCLRYGLKKGYAKYQENTEDFVTL